MQQIHFPSSEMIGQFRQFGELGPVYKIIRPIRPLDRDDWMVLVQVSETGEELEYPFSKIQQDPKPH